MKKYPHTPLFTQHPLALLACLFAAGIVSSVVLPTSLKFYLTILATLSVVCSLSLVKGRFFVAVLSLLLAMFFAGCSLALLERVSYPSDGLKRLIADGEIKPDDSLELTGVLNAPPEFARDKVLLSLTLERIRIRNTDRKTSGRVVLLASFQTSQLENEYLQLDLRYGSRLRVMTSLDRSDKYRNPGVPTLTEYLDRKGYDATGVVKSPLLIERLDGDRVSLPLAWLYDWRRQIQQQIDTHFSPETAGVLDAALLGNRYNLTKGTSERFRVGGTFHVLVISGLHISFIGAVVFLIARRLTRNRLQQFLLSTLFLWSYTIAVGAEGSVVRAALMFTLVALGSVIFRRASSVNALGGAGFVLLLWSPRAIFDPSLQLTFMSVFAIVVIAWPVLQTLSAIGAWRPTREMPYPPRCAVWLRLLCELLFWSERKWQAELARSAHTYRLFKNPVAARFERYRLQSLARYIFATVLVSISVQVVLLPFLIVYFHRLSFASLILNIGVSALLPALATVAVMALVVAQLSGVVAEPLFQLANGLNWVMVHSVDPFARLGLASTRLPAYTGWSSGIYALYYLPLVVLLVALSRWRPLAAPGKKRNIQKTTAVSFAAQLGMLGLVVFHPFSARMPDGKLHIDFLDVGQGDSALVTMPDGTTLLVDGGGRPGFLKPSIDSEPVEQEARSIGEAVVSEYLWWRGLDRVDYVLATHADADHIDGLNDVVRNFSVCSALVGRTPGGDPEYAKFAQTLTLNRTPLQVLEEGDVMRFGDVEVTVLWPPATMDANAPSQNNDSVVLSLRFGERTILLTGDIEKGAETAMIRARQNLHADVVKVPHHGSKTSSTENFVDATKPGVAVISVGRTSMFGHPHKEVVARWLASGAEVLTTGRCGTITVTTDGRELKVQRFVR